MKREVVKTDDGSSSIYIPELDEHYHSFHGAIQEARHVFIENGLRPINNSTIRVFEIGFGTGLNALLSLDFSLNNNVYIDYHAIEAFPVEAELVNSLNYVGLIDAGYKPYFERFHASEWDVDVLLSKQFKLRKVFSKIQNYTLNEGGYDIIFFDAFGPGTQSEMWTIDILQKMYDGLVDGGVLVTYCAQGQFKRNLKQLGFKVESLPGPPGKREMTKATRL